MSCINELSFEEIGEWLKKNGEQSYRASQIFYWLYQRVVYHFDDMTDLGRVLRKKLQDEFDISPLQLARKLVSSIDNTEKYLLRLKDNHTIESVVMPYERRCTICISTQVGCRFHCIFCASGKRGLIRNLSPAEIVEQVIIGKQQGHKITHIVFMGMGEPFDNTDNVIKAIRIFNHPQGFNIGARRITISTCGIPDGIEKLIPLNLQVELSVSLHGASDEIRNRLMPINKKHPLSALMRTIKKYINRTNRQVTFEYVLLKGINSSDEDILLLTKLLKGINCKVNLIPFNNTTLPAYSSILACPPTGTFLPARPQEHSWAGGPARPQEHSCLPAHRNILACPPTGTFLGRRGQAGAGGGRRGQAGIAKNFSSPSIVDIKRFYNGLIKNGIKATIRDSRGADIQGGCGQLSLDNVDSIDRRK